MLSQERNNYNLFLENILDIYLFLENILDIRNNIKIENKIIP